MPSASMTSSEAVPQTDKLVKKDIHEGARRD